ncbi:hypothetical protein RND71_021939 [Anisodus tanguticus]|uniref:Uncharacterized protein n=1 Tax=Anisodus tanguticus TaxID=243964 RepID=A0AAE1VGL6_9SOLA|nr:hypothetical protein RND71_021939 [Anisodus tanguticus]
MNISTLLMVNGHAMSLSPSLLPTKMDMSTTMAAVRKRLTGADPDLTSNERLIIGQFLEAYPDTIAR